jgi:hypothetical protein
VLRWPIREGVELRIPEERYADELLHAIDRNRLAWNSGCLGRTQATVVKTY